MLDGYKKAIEIHKLLGDLEKEYPISRHMHEWWQLARTIQITCQTILAKCRAAQHRSAVAPLKHERLDNE